MDPHQRPPATIRNVYKKYQKMKPRHLDSDLAIVDLSSEKPSGLDSKVRVVKDVDPQQLTASFRAFAGGDVRGHLSSDSARITVYEHDDMPGAPFPPLPHHNNRA